MPMKKTKFREILRLASLGQTLPDIARGADSTVKTVKRTLEKCAEKGLYWPLPDELSNENIYRLLYPDKRGDRPAYVIPDYEKIHGELKKKGVTRALLYEEYAADCKQRQLTPCSATTFNTGYARWAQDQNVVMHIDRKPAQKMEVDWAATKMPVVERATGEVYDVFVFVACLPFSGKIFAEGFFSMESQCWLCAHIDAFDYFGGLPEQLVPDNCKVAIIKNTAKECILNRAYADLAAYYGCAVVPARPRRPRDKANVEAAVGIVTRHAIAALRNETFFSLGELNAALAAKVEKINSMPFAKKPGSRNSVFESQEKQALSPLPAQPFSVCTWSRGTVRSDHHVAAAGCFYSVPFEYSRKVVDVRITLNTVEIFFEGVRIASHVKSKGEHVFVTCDEHRPENHRAYLEWNTEGLMKRAKNIGTSTERAMASLLGQEKTKKRSLGAGRSLLALARRYGDSVLERSCAEAISISHSASPTTEVIECLCKANYEKLGNVEDCGQYAMLRGKDYYENR